MTKFTEAERAGLAQLKEQIQNGQRSEHPKMSLLEQAEDIRARVETRVKYDDQEAMKQVITDRDRDQEVLVTKLWMQMKVERESEEERINLGIVVGTDRDNEDGTVLISSVLTKYDQSGNLLNLVGTQHIEAKILPGGRIFIREKVLDLRKERHQKKYSNTYSVVYPRPDQPESDIDIIVADEEEASILLKRLTSLVDSCLTNPQLSFSSKIGPSRRALSK